MDTLNEEIKNKILNILNSSSMGASSSEISKKISHNRVTVTKYLEIMRARNLVEYTGVAQAKLWKPIIKQTSMKKILIVDDEPHISELINLSIDSSKFKTTQVYDGKSALHKVFEDYPDAIILDLMLPEINGFEVCKILKQNPLTQKIPVLILSAKTEMDDKIKGLNVGADDYMTKPFDPSEIEHRIELLLQKPVHTNKNINPISMLNTIESVSKKKDFEQIHFEINNLEDYKKNYGNKKTKESIKIIANLISNLVKEQETEAVLYHTDESKFMIECKNKNFFSDINEIFEKALPFLYLEKDFESSKKLKLKKVMVI